MRTGLFSAAILAAFIGALEPHFPFRLADYDWAFHMATFFVLTLSAAWIGWSLRVVCLSVGSVGLLIELAQSLVPTRSVSGRDLLLNIAGIGAGLIAVILARALARKFAFGRGFPIMVQRAKGPFVSTERKEGD